jgi:hypothetical protein
VQDVFTNAPISDEIMAELDEDKRTNSADVSGISLQTLSVKSASSFSGPISVHATLTEGGRRMAKTIDPTGFEWRIKRGWFVPPRLGATGLAIFDFIIFLVVLPFLIAWPFWFASKWLGADWSIEIWRGGVQLDEQRVRGWRKSKQRIAELAQAADAGELTQQYPYRTSRQTPHS